MYLYRTVALSMHSCKFEAFLVYLLLLAHSLSIKWKIFPVKLELVIKTALFSHWQEKNTGKCSKDTTFDWEADDLELPSSRKAFLVVFANTLCKQSPGLLLPRPNLLENQNVICWQRNLQLFLSVVGPRFAQNVIKKGLLLGYHK